MGINHWYRRYFTAQKVNTTALVESLLQNNSVFIVHGRDEGAKQGVARFLEQIGVVPVILHEQINKGMTIIEKFENFANREGFAVVLMTPDDYGYPVSREENKKLRPRQNVLLELGYFFATLTCYSIQIPLVDFFQKFENIFASPCRRALPDFEPSALALNL